MADVALYQKLNAKRSSHKSLSDFDSKKFKEIRPSENLQTDARKKAPALQIVGN